MGENTSNAAALRLCGAFVAGGAVGACIAASLYTTRQRQNGVDDDEGRTPGGGVGGYDADKGSGRRSEAAAEIEGRRAEGSQQPSPKVAEDEILAEHFTRNVQFFGVESQQRVAESFVVVVGLGGVGSHCAHMLLRSGVSRLRLIDFDQVSLSSLNRHAVATRADVGTSKAECLAAHFREIYPEAVLDVRVAMYEESAEEELLGGNPDFVVDCIDNIDTKVHLLAACVRRQVPVLACGGAGAKCDPTRVRIVDIAESVVDPLARAVRHRLKRDHGIDGGVPVLLSTEKQRCELAPLVCGLCVWVPVEASEGVSMQDYQVVPNFRIRTIPVFGALPAIFGMACAAHVVTTLAGQGFDSEPVFRMQKKQYETQHERLRDREDARGSEVSCMGVDLELSLPYSEDVVYLVKDVWHARSARAQGSTMSKGMWHNTSGLYLTRWNPNRPACLDNLVLLTSDEADAHDAEMEAAGGGRVLDEKGGPPHEGLERLREREPEFVALVESRFKRVRKDFGMS